MSEMINAKGLACPQPVILTKKALDTNDEVTVLVDNTTALENIKRFASASGCVVEIKEDSDNIFSIKITKGQTSQHIKEDMAAECTVQESASSSVRGPSVFVISSNAMGKGNDELGTILMKSFIHTIIDVEHGPDILILYNAGVKFATADYGVVDDLKALEAKGVRILVCGTCVNFFELSGKIEAGHLSNMYEIAGTLSTAGRIVKP